MGFRDRRNIRAQQKQQALGQALQQDQRVWLPAPESMNKRDPVLEIGGKACVYLENCVTGDLGVQVMKTPIQVATLGQTDIINPAGYVVWDGSGCASSEFWAFTSGQTSGPRIYNVGAAITGGTTASCSGISAPSCSSMAAGMAVAFNHTMIWVNGNRALKWTRASGWGQWSVSVSGNTTANSFIGIAKFKNRLFAWENDSKFWYGSTDEILGTLNPFEIGGQLGGNIVAMDIITNDGGDGPDDYAIFFGDNGRAVMYEGTDPGDANAWAIVGSYQFGRLMSPQSKVRYGSQLLVMCEDDIYVLPEDLAGKRAYTHMAQRRTPISADLAHLNAVYVPKRGLLAFSDGTILDPKRGYAMSYYQQNAVGATAEKGYYRDNNQGYPVARYKGRLFRHARHDEFTPQHSVNEIFPSNGTNHNCRIILGPIKGQGRLQPTLINPEFKVQPAAGSAPNTSNLFRVGARFDKTEDTSANTQLDGLINWITASASADSKGLWIPLPGSGDQVTVHLQVTSASTSAGFLWLQGFNLTLSDTGGF